MALFAQLTGVPALPIISDSLFSTTKLSPAYGVYGIAVAAASGALIGIFMVNLLTVKKLLVCGYTVMSVCLICIVAFDKKRDDFVVLIFMIVLETCYQLTAGTYTLAYIGNVGNEKQISVANGVFWVLLLTTQTMLLTGQKQIFEEFCVFAAITICGLFFVICMVKNTGDLSKEQTQRLYLWQPEEILPPNLIVNESGKLQISTEPSSAPSEE